MNYEYIILGGGPSGIQLAYYFEKNNLNYIILEKIMYVISFKNYQYIEN